MRTVFTGILLPLVFWGGTEATVHAEIIGKSSRTEIRLSGDEWKLWRDVEAQWKNDELFLPPVDISKLPVNPPTGGWQAMYSSREAISVSVPGTVEEYFWDEIQGDRKTDESSELGDYLGVSWWWRMLDVPASAGGKRILLEFENNRLRSEVFVNETLVGYDMIGNSVFEIDITDAVKPGKKNTLAVRITDAGGNFIWPDVTVFDWGKYKIPFAHGFGGIAGSVDMRIVDPVYIDNVFIKNLPEMTAIDVRTTVQNSRSDAVTGALQIDVVAADNPDTVVFSQRYDNIFLQKGETQIEHRVSVPSAKLWHYDNPNLYLCKVKIEASAFTDQDAVRFGFRWFDVAGRGVDDHFVLNGKREFLLSSISWGFWPVNGSFPTEGLVEKQIRQAKGLNMNMLNFHRHKGQSMVLDKADELGLLYYAEPGGYRCKATDDEFAFKMARLKWLRMVKEFRNHPSLVIYNMMNEMGEPPVPRQMQDMLDAHAIDPTRIITYSSGFSRQNLACKLHMLPYDDKQYTNGWFDPHHATSVGVYRDSLYNSPIDYSYRYDESTRKEILFLGEEGAVGVPPRLQLINDYYKTAGNHNGWDGADYIKWFNAFDGYLKQKGLKNLTVDDVTIGMGNIQYYYHGRMIENAKINDLIDGYVINGWECEKMENHSGIVDSFRNYKGNPDIIRRYTRPVYVAIKARNKVTHISDTIDVDFYIVNEWILHGDYMLEVDLVDPVGKVVKQDRWPVSVSRERLGTLVKEKTPFALSEGPGYYTIHARLIDKNGTQQADGMEMLFAVDWKSAKLPTKGAVIEPSSNIHDFISTGFKAELPAYQDNMGKLDYIVLDNSVSAVPDSLFKSPDGKLGLKAEYFNKQDPDTPVGTRIETNINKNDPARFQGLGGDIMVIWTGSITPMASGTYVLCGDFAGQLNIWLNGELVINEKAGTRRKDRFKKSNPLDLEAGKSYKIKVQHIQDGGRNHALILQWERQVSGSQYNRILDRVANDGTTLIVTGNNTVAFAEEIAGLGLVKYNGFMVVDRWWKAGALFAVEHPLFKDLPQNTGMNWEYQDVVKYEMTIDSAGEFKMEYGGKRYGLLLEGEEVAGFCTNGHQHKVASTVSVVRHGKGKIVISCLDIYPYLGEHSKSSNSAKKILCNYIEYANQK
ncbi:MAG: PA14 domain-containing protein [Verrucomicrobia bacterium]|nr:PA14 domain-containing protein [Verrucomicrobiota bacterium]MDA1068885.1 PA14 domain-containing protein [Verrucomicrobiota bacterium]